MTEYARQRAARRKPPLTPDKPAPARKPRKTLKYVSDERKKLMATVGPERQARKQIIGECQHCRTEGTIDQLDVHEIAAGGTREKCLWIADLQIVLCRKCHKLIQGMPPAKQIAIRAKWHIDFACKMYCEVKGLAPTAVVADEVVSYLMYAKTKPTKKKRAKKPKTKGLHANEYPTTPPSGARRLPPPSRPGLAELPAERLGVLPGPAVEPPRAPSRRLRTTGSPQRYIPIAHALRD